MSMLSARRYMLTVRRGYGTWVTVALNSPTAPGARAPTPML
jgi:hypothetical protein